jgi:hypothetical protein
VKLTVKPARDQDVYKDIVRLNTNDRLHVRAGTIGKISVNGRSRFFIVRGLAGVQQGTILIDDVGREALAVASGQEYEFLIEPAGLIGQVRWACNVSDSAGRIAAWLGVWAVGLGAVGVALGAWAVWLALPN